MEHSVRVAVGAGIAMLVVCLLIGVVEVRTVSDVAPAPYVVGWSVTFVVFLTGLTTAALLGPTRSAGTRLLLLIPPVVAASALALLSPNRGGVVLILLVFTAAVTAAVHARMRVVLAVIGWNCAVVAAAGSALGPLVEAPNPPAELLFTVLLYALLQLGSAAMVWSQQRVAETLEEVSVAHVELRSTSALLTRSSQAQERLRISRELHDVLGHRLSALALELEVASHHTTGSALAHVARARSLTRELLGNVRTVVGNERHRPFDLAAALASVVGDVPRPRTHLEVDPGIEVDDERAVTLVRAVQEITTNAIRHSSAANLWLRIVNDGAGVRLEARDDGVGARDVVIGNGLRGLSERVAAVGGRVEFDGVAGFRVRAELPVAERVTA